jgi:hypothetical protein
MSTDNKTTKAIVPRVSLFGEALGTPISVEDRLPRDNTYVLARYTGVKRRDKDDEEGCVWKVVKFVRLHPGFDRGNNQRDYEWREFGSGKLFGQDVDIWCELPRALMP